VIEKRQAPDWDRANHLMATEIEPALTRLADQLATQVTHTRAEVDKMAGEMAAASQTIHRTLLLATTSVILLGTLVALCVPVAAAVNWTVVQHAQQHGHAVNLMPAVLIGAVLSSLATLPLALPFQASFDDLGLLALLGVVQLAIPCVLAVRCGRVLKAPEMALLGLLEVIFGILLAWLGAGEKPAPAVLTGGALVIGALVFNELLGWKEQK